MDIVDDAAQLIGGTPLIRLSRVTAGQPCAELLGKLESRNPSGSVKDRACLAMISEAEASGALRPGSTVIEPTSGNTGIGLAMICALKGYRCILTMPESMSLERSYLLKMYGAEVVLTPTRRGMEGAIRRAEELARRIPGSFIPHQFENAANVRAHRVTGEEILGACGGRLDAFVAGIGTGGTISGVGEVLKATLPEVRIIGVEPARSAVLSGGKARQHNIQGIGAGFVPPILRRDLIDRILTVEDREAFVSTRLLARKEGLCCGVSSGANLAAALRVARELGPGRRVVLMLCDTGERYFSLEQYFEA